MTDSLTLKLGWVIVYVEDPVATSAFYERAFGLRAEFAAYARPARRLRPRPVRDAR
jgi:predicted enzyme related to lactoylglutathione lyase